jgi:hypothetical protein
MSALKRMTFSSIFLGLAMANLPAQADIDHDTGRIMRILAPDQTAVALASLES